MISTKVKVQSSTGKKSGGVLPMGSGQAIKVTTSTSQGVSLITTNAAGAQVGQLAKKLSEGQHGSRNHLNQTKFSNQNNAAAGSQGNINLHLESKNNKQAFEISRNQVGSRGRSLGGAQSPNGVAAPRRNIQQALLEQQQQQNILNNGAMLQQSHVGDQNTAVNIIGGAPSGKQQRNSRASSTNPRPPTLQNSMQQQQFNFEGGKGGVQVTAAAQQIKTPKQFVNNSTNFTTSNTPLGGIAGNIQVQSQAQAIKRIRDSRQRGNKSIQISSQSDPQNQLMQAYINQTVTMNQKTPDFVGPSGQIRATEPMRIRAHSDLKKTGIQIGAKIQGVQNSREHLNQTTILTGNSQNPSLSQGIQQFHTRGNSINGTNMGLGIPNQSQKRSQSVDKNAPHFAHFNQSQSFAPSAHFGPPQQQQQQQQNTHNQANQAAQQPQVGSKDHPKVSSGGQHFIHDAIERKIERFSRQRNRAGGLHMSQGAPQIPANVYAQQYVDYTNGGGTRQSSPVNTLTGTNNSKGNLQASQNANQQASRAFKAQQKLQQSKQQSEEQAAFERQNKKSVQGNNTSNAQGQILMRGEIMSAGQANLPQRKTLQNNNQANNQQQQHHQAQQQQIDCDEPAAARNNNYLNTMIDGYQTSNIKKIHRGGARAGNDSHQGHFSKNNGATGMPTGPLLAQKVVQLPKQARSQAQYVIEQEEQKMIRAGKVKNGVLKRDGGGSHHDSPEIQKSPGKMTFIELDQDAHRMSPDKSEQRNKTKIAAAIQIQRAQQLQDEERKNTAHSAQVQGSQGQQVLSKQPRKEKIAVISLTTAKIDVRNQTEHGDSPQVQSEKQTMEPDEQAQLQGSKKRLMHPAPESPRSQPDDYGHSHKKRKHDQGRSNRTHSKGSVTVSMRDESFMHMSVNSVTDGNFILHEGDNQSHDSNDHFSIKKQMIRYLSRVADRNKPLFVFNQKLNLGGDSSEDDTGTPSFSLVALIEK